MWPDSLLERISKGHFVLFLGSGVSATASNSAGNHPPTWNELLGTLSAGLNGTARSEAEALITADRLLEAGELIRWTYQESARLTDYRNKIKLAVSGPPADPYLPGPVFDRLLDLLPRVVVTTNYDKLFEIASQSGFQTLRFESRLIASAVRRGEPVLLKIHGCTDAMEDVVLTRSDYTRVRADGAHALEVLRALFLTTTALFVGYSLSDPDVQLLLELGAAGMTNPESHYLLTRGEMGAHDQAFLRSALGVSPLAYDASLPLVDVLADLANQVDSLRDPAAP